MRRLRKLVRVTLAMGVTGVLWTALMVCLLLTVPSPKLRRRARNFLFRAWSRTCLKIVGGRVVVEGVPPRPPFFLASNHLSYVDIIVLASVIDATFVAKAEIRGWPLFGLLCRSVGTIFVNREMRRDVLRVNALISDFVDRGYGVILFPEGTSTQGYEVARFRSSLLDFPVRHHLPVWVSALSYRTPPGEVPAHLAICWWGDAPFLPHISQFFGLGGFEVTVRFGSEPVLCADRKQLARELHERVSGLFDPVVAPEHKAEDTGF